MHKVAKQGLDQAIVDGNHRVLYILQSLGLHEVVDETTLKWTVQHAGGDRTAVTSRIFSMLAGKHPGDEAMWSDWFDSIYEAVHQGGRTIGEREQERRWADEFIELWLRHKNSKSMQQ